MDRKSRQLTRSARRTRSVLDETLEEKMNDWNVPTDNVQTPLRRSIRKTKVSQSESKFKRKSVKPRQYVCENVFKVAVDLPKEQTTTPQSSLLKRNRKLWQKCVVNLECLTPTKLNLVKTESSPLLKIRDLIANRNTKANEVTIGTEDSFVEPVYGIEEEVSLCSDEPVYSIEKEKPLCSDEPVYSIEKKKPLCSDDVIVNINDIMDEESRKGVSANSSRNENDVIIVVEDMNNTFTIESDECLSKEKDFIKQGDVTGTSFLSFNSTPSDIFKSIPTDFGEISKDEQKRLSISQKLAKSKPKPQKLSNSSKVTKTSRLSTVGSSRTPKISGTKAIQLYEFLTDKQFGGDSENKSETKDDVRLIDSVPSCSSTPKSLKKHIVNSLLKSTLKKSGTVTFADTINSSSKDKDQKLSRNKMPNFALIHKKQFDKMENISDYHQRKGERAKLLLSGSKCPKNTSNISTPKSKSIKKELVTSFNKTPIRMEEAKCKGENTPKWKGDNSLKWKGENSPMLVCESFLNSSVLPQDRLKSAMRKVKLNQAVDDNQHGTKTKEKKVVINISPDKATNFRPSGLTIRKTPFKENLNENRFLKLNKVDIQSQLVDDNKPLLLESTKSSQFNSYVQKNDIPKDNKVGSTSNRVLAKTQFSKENNCVGKASKLNVGKPSKEKHAYTRFGFQLRVKNRKEEVVKAVVNKMRLPAVANTTTDETRAIIKGVRSNRRFDLLMKMRLNK